MAVNDVLLEVYKRLRLKSDADLCRATGMHSATISRLRSGKTNFTAEHILVCYDVAGMPIELTRELLIKDVPTEKESNVNQTIQNMAGTQTCTQD